jgi:molybdopterin-guanine dinucleotide biosynthesis protein A
MTTTGFDAVVLAGGAASRLGGTDKPALTVGGLMLLDRVLGACASAAGTVVVGPRRPTARPVRWTREEPPGGGPLPALAAGLAALGAGDGGSGERERPGIVLVLAADLPFLTADTVAALAGALAATDDEGVLLVDAGGRDQPLAAAYRADPLRREIALLSAEHGGLSGLPLRLLTGELALRRMPDPTGEASFDCDTWDDVAAARARSDAASEG